MEITTNPARGFIKRIELDLVISGVQQAFKLSRACFIRRAISTLKIF
jgi:hypothetical protein